MYITLLQGVGAHGFSVWAKTTKVCDYNQNGINNTAHSDKSHPSDSAQTVQNARRRTLTGSSSVAPNHLKRRQREGSILSPTKDNNSTRRQNKKKSNDKTRNAPLCESVRLKGACHAAGGPHWRVQEAAHYGNAQQRGRKWHPPIGMHLLRAEMLVYTYVHIMLDAIYWVEEKLSQRSVDGTKISSSSGSKKSRSVAAFAQELLKGIPFIITAC